MKFEKLWKVLPFPKAIVTDRSDISPENWVDFADFLTNQSDGVFVAIVEGSGVKDIKDGNIITVDKNLEPQPGDAVVAEDMTIVEYTEGKVFGVITCVVIPTAAHKRQRQT